MQNKKIFTTMNRKLEQVLYNHGINFICQTKDLDGMTIWKYESTPELQKIVTQFRASKSIRNTKMKLAYVNPKIK